MVKNHFDVVSFPNFIESCLLNMIGNTALRNSSFFIFISLHFYYYIRKFGRGILSLHQALFEM